MDTLIEDLMTRDVAAVRSGTAVDAIARLLDRKGITAVPVVDDADRLVGFVSRSDIVRRYAIGDDMRLADQ